MSKKKPTSSKRRQQVIPGIHATPYPEIEEAAMDLCAAEEKTKAAQKEQEQASAALLIVMQSRGVEKYRFYDDSNEEREVYLPEHKPKPKVRKTGEAEPEIGTGVSSGDSGEVGVHPGLIEQALAAQKEAGVEVDDAGDVVVPEQKPKRVRDRSGDKGRKRSGKRKPKPPVEVS